MRQAVFSKRPPQSGGFQPQGGEKRISRIPKRLRPRQAETICPGATKTEQCTNTQDVNVCFPLKNISVKSTVEVLASRGIVPISAVQAQAGRLQYHIDNWKVVSRDRWILETIQGYPLELVSEPHQRPRPQPPRYNQEQNKVILEEIQELLQKGVVTRVETQDGFYSTLFLVPKKDGGQRPVINLKALNGFVQNHHFKMEGIHTLKELVRPGDWLTKVDLKDAYFTIPIRLDFRCLLRFTFQEESYEFTCLPFGLSSAPWVFTKTLKPVAGLLRELGIRMIIYIDDMLILAESRSMAQDQVSGVVYLLECLGFIVNFNKSVLEPTQTLEFLGVMVDTRQMSSEPAPQQDQEDPCRGSEITGRTLDISALPGLPPGQDECSLPGDSTSPPLLQVPTNGLVTSSGCEQTKLRDTTNPLARREGGARMVGHQDEGLEWQGPVETGHRSDHRLRCVSQGLGDSLCHTADRRSMVCARKDDAYKLSRAAGSYPSSPDLYEGQDRTAGATEDRQHYSSSIHKSPGWHSLKGASHSNKGPVDVVPGEEYPHHSTACPRSPELHSRCRVSKHGGPDGLDAGPSHFQENRQLFWSHRGGLVCLTSDKPVPMLLQLAARSLCSGNGCLSSGLDADEGFCQPAVVPDRPDPTVRSNSTGQYSATGPSLEDPALVSSSSGNANRLSPVDSNQQLGHGGSRTDAPNPQTGRMAYLRDMLRSQEFSEEATTLLLKSWRSKTNKSYDSLFGKWAGWCHERSLNPFSAPVTDVANFLATLHSKGYKYNSINAYRSAISSVHEKIDGSDVGQHPTITRLMKGIFNDRPPLPRYTNTWDVQTVLNYLRSLGDNASLSLKLLTLKTVMLLALTRPSRSADLSQLDLSSRRYKPDGVEFLPKHLAKQSRRGRPIASFFFPSFSEEALLCPVQTLKSYESATGSLRGEESRLFIAIIKPHKPVSSSTIARWLKLSIELAGIDTAIFKPHSTRGASASAAANMGITTNEILKAANWSSESVFQKFYYKPSENTSFGRSVLSAGRRSE